MGSVESRLTEMGLELPAAPKPLAQYVPAKRVGLIAITSGQVPMRDGAPLLTGQVGGAVSLEQGRQCALLCALNALAAIKGLVGSLDDVAEIVQLRGFVNSAPGFGDQPEVLNAASELMVALFGEAGRHTRSAVGTNTLPRNLPVELEMMVRLKG